MVNTPTSTLMCGCYPMTNTWTIKTNSGEKTYEDEEKFNDVVSLLEKSDAEFEILDTPATAETSGSGETQYDGPTSDESPQNANAGVSSEREYLTEDMGVPELFILQVKGGNWHVTKQGYYYLADQQGISYTVEPLNPTYEGDDSTSVWLGRATDGEREWSNVGTAHLDGENMGGAKYNLDELAATRAACRVLSMATGVGAVSKEEMTNE